MPIQTNQDIAAELLNRFEAATYLDPDTGIGWPYRILRPETDHTRPAEKTWPLVLFLHGAGERGDDNLAQLGNGAAEFLGTEQKRREFPCFFVLPQCPLRYRWVEVAWDEPHGAFPQVPSVPMDGLKGLLCSLQNREYVNPEQMYAMGLSMGGFGVLDLLFRLPEMFAAAVSICGGGDRNRANDLVHIPLWLFHGNADPVVPVARSRDMAAAFRELGSPVRYTEYEGAGHAIWDQVLREPQLLPWLFGQKGRATRLANQAPHTIEA